MSHRRRCGGLLTAELLATMVAKFSTRLEHLSIGRLTSGLAQFIPHLVRHGNFLTHLDLGANDEYVNDSIPHLAPLGQLDQLQHLDLNSIMVREFKMHIGYSLRGF